MESSQYFIAKSDKYVLVRKIGNRFFRIISDTNITPVELIYQKICSEGYTSEQELFQDIFDLYGNISIFHLIRETIVLCPNDSLKTWQFNIFYVSIISQFRHNCNEVFLSMSCISI